MLEVKDWMQFVGFSGIENLIINLNDKLNLIELFDM